LFSIAPGKLQIFIAVGRTCHWTIRTFHPSMPIWHSKLRGLLRGSAFDIRRQGSSVIFPAC
jgi:hypothetical protein